MQSDCLLDIERDAVSDRYLVDAASEFRARGIVRLPRLLSAENHQRLKEHAQWLLQAHGRRRDLEMQCMDDSPRHMHNVDGADVLRHSTLLPRLYDSGVLREFVSRVIGEPALVCPYERERMVITCLERDGDTHGWHWDDYSIALIWILQAPPLRCGGLVQCVPHTRWDRACPDVFGHLVANPIYSYYFASGEAYLMQTHETLHRVLPLTKPTASRIIINFAFATMDDLDADYRHESFEALWGPVPDGGMS